MLSQINKGTEFLIIFPIAYTVDEICATAIGNECIPKSNVIEKIDIEFSDIYINRILIKYK